MKRTILRLSIGALVLFALCGGAGALPYIVQEHYRWRNDDGSESAANPKQDADTMHTLQLREENVRLRLCVANTGWAQQGTVTNLGLLLQYATNQFSATWTDVPTTNDVTDEAFGMSATPNYVNAVTLTTDLLGGSGDFTSVVTCTEAPSNTTAKFDFPPGKYVNLEYCLQATTNAQAHLTYYFRLFGDAAYPQALDQYNVYPALQIATAPLLTNGVATPYASGALLGGGVTDTGGDPPDVTVWWGPTNAPQTVAETAGEQSGAFEVAITNLLANTNYAFQCFATNVAGDLMATPAIVFTTAMPRVTFEQTYYTVSESSGSIVTVGVSLVSTSAVDVSIDYGTADQTAGAGDYTGTNGTITWPALTTGTSNIVISITHDIENDENELFSVVLSNASFCVVGGSSTATVQIIDDDDEPAIQFETSTSSANESNTPALVSLMLSHSYTNDVSVDFTVFAGTATSPGDYAATNGTMTIVSNSTATGIVVVVVDDAVYEPDKTFTIVLSNAQNCALGLITNHTHTIIDTDVGAPEVNNSFGAVGISASQVTLRGNVTETRRDNPDVSIFWGQTDGGDSTNLVGSGSWSNREDLGEQELGSFGTNLTSGLSAGDVYYYRCYATNAGGYAWATTSEVFIAVDPPVVPLLVNEDLEIEGSSATDAEHWGVVPSADKVERVEEFPRSGSFSARFVKQSNIVLHGVGQNAFKISWNGQYNAYPGYHAGGGIRPGFVLSGRTRVRARLPGQDSSQFKFSLTYYKGGYIDWMAATSSVNDVVYQTIGVTNSTPIPTNLMTEGFYPATWRLGIGSGTEDRFHVDGLELEAGIPVLDLLPEPTNALIFPNTRVGQTNSSVTVTVRSLGGASGSLLYGAYITNSSDLVSASWADAPRAWHDLDDTDPFTLLSDDTLFVTNDSGFRTYTFSFNPAASQEYTGFFRIATTCPTNTYGTGGTLSNGIIFEQYEFRGTGFTTRGTLFRFR